MSKIITLAHQRPARMSRKFREVLRLHEIEGMSVTDACAKVGYSRAAFYKACKNPAVKDLIRDLRRELIESAEAKKAFLKFKALEVAFELMTTSRNEAIRARMVEFLAADAKVSPVSVHVDASRVEQVVGYTYKRPEALDGTAVDEAGIA